jgi:hypothetical protein
MLKSRPEVAIEDVRIETWLDPKSPLKPNVIHVQFLQRWRSPRYADHGPKIMQLYVAPDGKTRRRTTTSRPTRARRWRRWATRAGSRAAPTATTRRSSSARSVG